MQASNTLATAYPAYDSYKDSGVDWLGEIPEGWEIHKFRNAFNFNKGLNITKQNLQETGVLCVNYGEIHSKYGFELNPNIHDLKCVNESYLSGNINSLVKRGDFVFADTSEDIEGSGNFTHLITEHQIFAGYHTVITRPKIKFNSRFVSFIFDSIAYRHSIRKLVKGVKVYSITQTLLKQTNIWLPPLEVQTKIAEFLDQKTTQIDQAIALKQQQIDKLNEYKQIVIQNAVTKGLNPDAPMKDSGVAWIGVIPEHWEVKKLKYLCNVNKKTLSDNPSPDLTFSYVDIGSVTFADGIIETQEFNFANAPSRARRLASEGDTVVSTVRTYLKAVDYIDKKKSEYVFSTGFAVISPIKGFLVDKYLTFFAWSEGFTNQVDDNSIGVSYPAINSTSLENLFIAQPPVNEQFEICNFINIRNTNINESIRVQNKQINRLQEYKTVLINQAVTGKIKV